jgi:hypothetical protein
MNKWRQAILLIALFALALGIRIFWFSQKEGLHVDEGLTIAIACCNDYMVTANYEYGKKYTGKELKEISLISDTGLKDALADIHSLWVDTRSPPHTNLYYTLFRLSLIGLKTGDIAPIIVRGGILNLLIFTVSFIYFFLLMRLLFTRSILLQCAATFCAFMSTASISNTLLLRSYQIQEMMFIIFCYYFVLSIGWRKFIIHENNLFISIRPITFMSLIIAITLLTGYYAVLFIALFGLYAVYFSCRNKTFIEIPFYFVILCFGILFAQILYPKYVSGFFSYRGLETIITLSGNISENILSSIKNAGMFLHKHFFTYPVIAVSILCLLYITIFLIRDFLFFWPAQKLHEDKSSNKPTIKKTAWYIFSASFLLVFIILILAPYKILRYVMPVFPFLVILPMMLIHSLEKRSKKIGACAMIILCACLIFNATREKNIENIFRGKPNEYVFTQDKNMPVYVVNASWSIWKYANLIPYVHDEQTYYFIDWYTYFDEYISSGQNNVDIHLPEAENYNVAYLLTEYFPDFPPLDNLLSLFIKDLQSERGIIESEFSINTGEPETQFPFFKGKKILTAR